MVLFERFFRIFDMKKSFKANEKRNYIIKINKVK